ncbi:MAG TPA: hypothetical protein VKE96_21680 [Vicinamibacterales bacterium]|nr:hypothetical protein [Vicinamibacterales bacterium]
MTDHVSEWSLDVDEDWRVVSVKAAGVVTATDVLLAQHVLAAHTRFNPSFALLLDLRLASDFPVTIPEVRTIVERSPIALDAPRVIVADTIVSSAVAHGFRAFRDTITGIDVVHVCRSMSEARQWLVGYRSAFSAWPRQS